MRTIFAFVLLCLASTGAHAQHLQVPGTPTAVIHDNVTNTDVTIGLWAEHNAMMGDYICLGEKIATGWLCPWTSAPFYPNWGQSVKNDPHAFIVSQLPGINGAIANRFALPAGGPPPTGQPTSDAVNMALYQGFKFKVLSDGTMAFVAD